MSQQVQELIEKIKTEGIHAAGEKAKEIEGSAKTDAQKVIDDASTQAQQIIANANAQAQKIQSSTQMALKHAARDTLLALRKEIEGTLQKVISTQVKDALSSENLANIISEAVTKSVETKLAENDILVVLNSGDLKKLSDGFVAKLQKGIKQTIKLQSSDDIGGGFTISFDEGKSCFDFSDSSLTQYLSFYLNAQVATLLQEAA